MQKTLELKLTNGTTIIRTFKLEKIYDIVGRIKKKRIFSWRFPFIRTEYISYTTFKYQDVYETMTSNSDSYFSVLLSPAELMFAFGVDFESYEEIKLKGAVATGD